MIRRAWYRISRSPARLLEQLLGAHFRLEWGAKAQPLVVLEPFDRRFGSLSYLTLPGCSDIPGSPDRDEEQPCHREPDYQFACRHGLTHFLDGHSCTGLAFDLLSAVATGRSPTSDLTVVRSFRWAPLMSES